MTYTQKIQNAVKTLVANGTITLDYAVNLVEKAKAVESNSQQYDTQYIAREIENVTGVSR